MINLYYFIVIMLDIAIQLHYGDEIGEDIARYHVDALNSLLHLGLSIHGDRYYFLLPFYSSFN